MIMFCIFALFMKPLRIISGIFLFPFVFIYGFITEIRNLMFEIGILKQFIPAIPVICIGNLNAGGTGKTPMVEYIIDLLLKQNIKIAVLSRGYGRKSKGFLMADKNCTAADIGDEPFQIYCRFEKIHLAVCEKRVEGVQRIMHDHPETDVILLDDAFQHRYLKAGLNILLTTFKDPFFNDCLLPAGRLRERRKGAKRANMVVVSRSPENFGREAEDYFRKKIIKLTDAPVFFSFLKYGKLQRFSSVDEIDEGSFDKNTAVLLFTGIADCGPIEQYVSSVFTLSSSIRFSDHHTYTEKDTLIIMEKFANIASQNKIMLTTAKDAARLNSTAAGNILLSGLLYVLPVASEFFNKDKDLFDQLISEYAQKN